MLKRLLFIALMMAFSSSIWGQAQAPSQSQPEYKIPPEAAARQNPVKPTPEGLAKAKKIYGIDCAMCHGNNGDGKGDMEMKGVPDFTDPAALKNRTDGELFYIIEKGKGDMPPEGSRAKDEDLWNLVNYVRSFARK